MRSTKDVIDELDREALNHRVTGLVVGFEHCSEVIFGDDPNKRSKLNAFVEQGGQPIGFLWADYDAKEAQMQCRLLDEFENEAWAKDYMQVLLASTAKTIEARSGGNALLSGMNDA